MAHMIFINLPVGSLPDSVAFYEAIGFVKQPDFSDDTAACMKFSETIFAMLLTHPKYRSFTSKDIVDARRSSEVLLALTTDERAGVDDFVARAGKAGGKLDPTPKQDAGFMYGRSFEDPDGHIWEVFWMDPAAVPASQP
ncbi:MAG TPA: lactoylglutathione lyase [Hyphomicrobiaceae bacterium]|nr:lactoylglutathione lyase [Hyphomicrobiaceae bacterium]